MSYNAINSIHQNDVNVLMEADMADKTTERPQNSNIKEAREHMRAARENMHKVAESFLPEGTRDHQRAARKEFLMGLRSLLDAAIEHTEKASK